MVKELTEDILILGAGPAGMACAMELHNANRTSKIIEKSSAVGGFSKTLEFKEGDLIFRTDIGPHRFFSKNAYLYEFIEGLLGEKWIVVNRQTRQVIDGKFYDYPINAIQAFKNIGVLRSIGMGFSYLNGVIKYGLMKKKIKTFEDYIVANFGKKLGEFNMLNYTEKIWGIPCNQVHADWATQRIKGLNLRSALKDALFKKKKTQGPKSLVDQFYYPQYGTGLIYEAISKKIIKGGSSINNNSYPKKIKHLNNKITEVDLNLNGKEVKIRPNSLVSSISITELINLLDPKPPIEVMKATSNLKWRAQVYLFITLDREQVTKDNWLYFPNKGIPFGRITEMKNFSKDMSPKDKTSLFVEFFVNEGDEVWNMNNEDLLNLALKHLTKMRLFSKEDIRSYYVFKKKNVYPVYDLNYQKNLRVIKDYLNKFKNLIYIGRPGRFHYTNQDHSLEMGIYAARSLLDNKFYDLDKVGSENEYFEKGNLKNE